MIINVGKRNRVRVGSKYIFYANLLDCEHRDLNGLVGTVVNLHGCPPANTMGHCYFQVDGERFRLVSTNSLYKLSERQIVITAMNGDIAREKLHEVNRDRPGYRDADIRFGIIGRQAR